MKKNNTLQQLLASTLPGNASVFFVLLTLLQSNCKTASFLVCIVFASTAAIGATSDDRSSLSRPAVHTAAVGLKTVVMPPPVIIHVTESGTGNADGSSWDNALSGTDFPAALASAPANATFLVASGLYKPTTTTDQTASFSITAGVQVYGGFTVVGNTGIRPAINPVSVPSSTTFSGNLGGSIYCYHVVQIHGNALLDGVLITEGNANDKGGGIYSMDGSFTITNTTVTSNTATTNGGGIYSVSATAALIHCSFSNNIAFDGGGIYSQSSNLVLTDVSLSQNTATQRGGGVYSLSSTVGFDNSSLIKNTAQSAGGAYYIDGTEDLIVNTCFMSQNMVKNGSGGAIYLKEAKTAIITSTTLSQNSTTSQGGGLYIGGTNPSSLTLINSILSENVITGSFGGGGGIYMFAGLQAHIQSSTLHQNSSSQSGAALFMGSLNSGSATLTLFNSVVTRNKTSSPGAGTGGAIFIGSDAAAIITSSTLSQNTATGDGGALFIGGSNPSSLTLINSDVSQNLITGNSGTGGGIKLGYGQLALIQSSTLSDNSSVEGGGALMMGIVTTGASLTLSNSIVTRNRVTKSGNNGGAIYIPSSGSAVITGSILSQNTATSSGGGLFIGGYSNPSSLTILSSNISDNELLGNSSDGGGIYVTITLSTHIESSTLTRNTARTSGGALFLGSGSTAQLALMNSQVSMNRCTANNASGGGISFQPVGIVRVSSSSISQNTATSSGAGLYLPNSVTLSVENSEISRNTITATGNGAGILLNSGGIAHITSSSINQNTSQNSGAGLYLGGVVSLTVNNCQFIENQVINSGQNGGAIYSIHPNATNLVESSTLVQNSAAAGGAIHSVGDLRLYNSVLRQNSAVTNGGAVYSTGSVYLINSSFKQNQTRGSGTNDGGGALYTSSAYSIANSSFSQNTAVSGGAILRTGFSGPNEISNSLFSRNVATRVGGAILTRFASGSATNLSISGNTAPSGSAIAIVGTGGSFSLTNSIVWGNNTPSNSFTVDADAALTLAHSIIDPVATGFMDGGNNLTLDPKFVNASADDLMLTTCSPAINAGDDAANSTAFDLAGQSRKIGTIDLGAYEFQNSPEPLLAITDGPVATSVVCPGTLVSVAVSFSGTPTSYSWYKNGSIVNGQTSATLSIPVATTDDTGSYSLVISNACFSVTSSAFSLSVHTAPSVSITSALQTIASGESVTLTASGATSYTWNTGADLPTISTTLTQTTPFSVTGIDQNGCSGQATALVTVDCSSSILADVISVTQTAVLGAGHCSVILNGTGYGTNLLMTGPGGYVFSGVYRKVGTYVLDALDVKLPGIYTFKVTYTDSCGNTNSDTMTYDVVGTACQ